jgi:hypothetical protein
MTMLREPMRAGSAAAALLLVLALSTDAAAPASGTLTPTSGPITFDSGPFAASNPTPVPLVDSGPRCNSTTNPCDSFELTVELPAGFAAANPGAFIRITTAWAPANADVDLWVFPGGTTTTDGSDAGLAPDGASSAMPEIVTLPLTADLSKTYTIKIVPFAATGVSPATTIEMIVPPPLPPDEDGDGVTDAKDACPGTPPGTPVDSSGCEITGPPAEQCSVPGPELFADADGDNLDLEDDPAFDLRGLKVAELNYSSGKQLVFTLKVDSLAQLPAASSRWIVPFQGADNNYYYVQMIKFADNSAPLFEFGSTNETANPGCFAALGPLDGKSKFDVDGTITLVVNAAQVGGLAAGDQLKNITARAQGLNGTSLLCGTLANWDTAGPGTFTSSATCPVIVEPPQQAPSGLAPRFHDFQSPNGVADSAGEPTIGYNPATKNAMFIAGVEVDRITFAENGAAIGMVDAAGDPLPEACAPLWQDKSYAGAVNTLDPILETEPVSGRTFQSSLSGANSIFAFSDDDGDTWIPAQAGPPNGGVDHQTVGVGPWAPGAKPLTATEDYAIYYCSQSIVAAFCSRSDNGGLTFGPGINFRDTLSDCNNTLGGLHGHVQVARNDGTVYVPFGNCGNHVGMGVSSDSGITWEVNTIPQSGPGDDPGLGVADDGTVYTCYADGTSGPFASKSTDKGRSWTGKYNLGTSHNIRHAVFLTAVAGDGDRAACAFLGTQDAGNPNAEDFEGVWYPYVSVTYDGGDSWHTVNVSPNDPVQGWGGICQAGVSCGGNRNLLDFNDIIMDDQGRLLFGYADGCRGACVTDPTRNTFSDNGVVARQSGGRTLRAAFDGVGQFNATTPVKPAAACARQDLSLRTDFETRVTWSAPDTGGSEILNYKVYRATAATGPFDFIADAGKKTSVIDPTTDATVPVYYYRVVAENAPGVAAASNVIELPITVPEIETSCELPGITVARESSPGACAQNGCTPPTDVQSLHVAELPGSPDHVVITVKVASLNPAPAPGVYWFVLSKKQTGENLYVAMETASGAPRFVYGTYAVGTLTTFTEQGELEPASAWETNGTIRLVAPRALFGGLDAGDVIPSLEVRTRTGDSSAPSNDLIGPGDYTVRGTRVCLPNTPPVAVLSATPQAGGPPLGVTFDGTGSYDNDVEVPDAIRTWVISFGDGTSATAEAALGETPVWQHTYPSVGFYSARLRVTDTRGLQSENPAEKVISVDVGAGVSSGDTNTRMGGALPGTALLLLGLLGAGRRARRTA